MNHILFKIYSTEYMKFILGQGGIGISKLCGHNQTCEFAHHFFIIFLHAFGSATIFNSFKLF